MSIFTELYEEYRHPSIDSEVLADKITDALMELRSSELKVELRQLVLTSTKIRRRLEVGSIEKVASCSDLTPRNGREAPDVVALRKSLLEREFHSYERHEMVKWGDATLDDHRSYMNMLEGHLSGIRDNIGRHQQAIDALIEADVACLYEWQTKTGQIWSFGHSDTETQTGAAE